LTNGPPPTSPEKPALRTDLPTPGTLGPGGESVGGVVGGDRDSGDAGRGGGANDPADPTGARPTASRAPDLTVPGTPPTIVSPSPAGAQGGTKPTGNINDGTPRSPQ
jgi:hypothetical protein